MRFFTIFIVVFLLQLDGFTQSDLTKKHWHFGRNAYLQFNTAGVVVNNNSPINGYSGTTCYSDKTGKLLLYSNGNTVYSGNNLLIGFVYGNREDEGNIDQIILPKNEALGLYYLFSIEPNKDLVYSIIDLKANSGKGAIISKAIYIGASRANNITAIKHCYADAYWLVSPTINDQFETYLVRPSGISDPIVSSPSPPLSSIRYASTGSLISNHAGTQLAFSLYYRNEVDVYDFDKECGIVSNLVHLPFPTDQEYNYPHGLEYSADDKILYVCHSYQESQIVQYKTNDFTTHYLAATSKENFNDICLAPDGRMYINTHISGIPSNKLDVIHNPNNFGPGVNYEFDYIRLKGFNNGSFEFPNFINCHDPGGCGEQSIFTKDNIKVSKGRCTNEPVSFNIDLPLNSYDSIRWVFDDPTSAINTTTSLTYTRWFPENRIYKVELYLYYCSYVDTLYYPLDMRIPPLVDLGSDTTLCFGDSILLEVNTPHDSLRWSNGSTSKTILAANGSYGVKVYNGGCAGDANIEIGSLPKIWIELGQEYFICDVEQETQLLDAGKGYKTYLWHPTGDTSQWIVVKDLGEYIVVVDDYRGCKGEGGTIVRRRCDIEFYIPNAFSPNNDQLNDYFTVNGQFIDYIYLRIYNRWGNMIYENEGPKAAWNGLNASEGVYFYQVEISGYQNKKLVHFTRSGTVHLLR